MVSISILDTASLCILHYLLYFVQVVVFTTLLKMADRGTLSISGKTIPISQDKLSIVRLMAHSWLIDCSEAK